MIRTRLALAQAFARAPGRVPDRPVALLAVIGGSLMGLLLVSRLWWLPAHAPLNVNEGWNALHAAQAIAGSALYPAPDGLTANNYPPVSFYVVGVLGWMLGDNVIAGRIVSALSELAVAVAMFAIVRTLTRSRTAAWIGVLLFAGFAATMLRRYAVMNDPQWLGVAATSWAMVLVVRGQTSRGQASRGQASRDQASDGRGLALVAAAAVLTVIGLMTKHNTVAIPVALTCWLWIADRRALVVWCGVGGALGIAALAAIAVIWGEPGLLGIFQESRSYSPGRMLAKGLPDLMVLVPGVVACAAVWRKARPGSLLPMLLLAAALPLGLVQRAGAGVDINAFFEAVIALSIAVAVACAAEPTRHRLLLVVTVLPMLCLAPLAIRDQVSALAGRDAAVRQWGVLIARVAAAKGPVACDDQAVCYWAGREAGIDFFATKQRLLSGRGRAATTAITCRRFAMIEMRLDDPSWHDDLLRPMIFASYRPVFQDGGRGLLVPREGPRDARCRTPGSH